VVLMAIWWILESVPFAVTALLPFVLFPLLGLQSAAATAPLYFNSIIFLFLGGFLIALAMERWNLHRRIALHVLVRFGHSPALLVLGFMVACALLSAWISNTATTLAMLPVGLAVLSKLGEHHPPASLRPLGICLMLGIAYASSIGGLATPVGTPPNLAFRAIFAEMFPALAAPSFAQWCFFAAPLALAMLLVAWFILCHLLFRSPASLQIDRTVIPAQLAALGPMRREEILVAIIFTLTALLWIFREPIQLEAFQIPGWQIWLPRSVGLDDGAVAIFMAILLFLLPARDTESGKPTRLLTGEVFARIPWGVILLFGGGYAMAKGFQDSGLSAWLASALFSQTGAVSPLTLIFITCLMMTFLTEFTSNTPSTQLVLPIVGAVAVAQNIDPLLLMIPATLSASMAFMMPVATPPNAIVFGTGRVGIWDMVKAGFLLNIAGVLLVTLMMRWLFPLI
jgi:sodium-dependent dicarboxylate transporter 2/3/5